MVDRNSREIVFPHTFVKVPIFFAPFPLYAEMLPFVLFRFSITEFLEYTMNLGGMQNWTKTFVGASLMNYVPKIILFKTSSNFLLRDCERNSKNMP